MNLGKFFSATKRLTLMGALAGLATVSLAACGGDNPPAATNTPQGNTGEPAQQVKVSITEWAINPKDTTVNAGQVRFIVSNEGQFPHDLSIEMEGDDAKTPTFKQSDGPMNLDVDLAAGTYTWYCSIGDHKDKGMVGQLTVK